MLKKLFFVRIGLLLLSFMFCVNLLDAQVLTLKTSLVTAVQESSGLFALNNRLFTHNDSGGEPAIYEVDTLTGNVISTVFVRNATNIDWEDVTLDESFIYIGDFGNNLGTRTNLKIYKLNQSDFLNTLNDTIDCEVISFSYADQTSFSSSQFSTNFDAEAFVALNDSLFVFTKNWGNLNTNIYGFPNSEGNYVAEKVDSLNTGFLVTSAALSENKETLVLIGYNFSATSYLLTINGVTGASFSNGDQTSSVLSVPAGYSKQIEGIAFTSPNSAFVSSEAHSSGASGLYQLVQFASNSIINNRSERLILYPNPSSGFFQIKSLMDFNRISLIDAQGRILYESEFESNKFGFQEFNVSNFVCKGQYLLILEGNSKSVVEKLIVVD